MSSVVEAGHGEGECAVGHTYGYIAIPVVALLSVLGALTPTVLQRVRPTWDILHQPLFRFLQGMAGGFVISVALVHSFAESVESLGSEEAGLPEYAWGGLFALIGILTTWSVEVFIGVYLSYRRQRVSPPPGSRTTGKFPLELKDAISLSEFPLSSPSDVAKAAKHAHQHDHEHDAESDEQSHSHSSGEDDHGSCASDQLALVLKHEQRVKHYTTLMILLFGLSFHSVFVGFAIGLSDDRALFIAILAHQFFEALALGSHICRSQIRDFWFILLIVGVFTASAPVGTGIGIGISVGICNDPGSYTVVEGIFNSLAAGILIYVGSVHMIAEEFKRPEVVNSWKNSLLVWSGVILGAALMAVLGIWA